MAFYDKSLDDEFDDEAEDREVAQKDWHKTEADIRTTGYRLGLSAGQEEALQRGFDTGYRAAAQTSFCNGRLQGHINACLSLLLQRFPPSLPDHASSHRSDQNGVLQDDIGLQQAGSVEPESGDSHPRLLWERCQHALEALTRVRNDLPAQMFDHLHRQWLQAEAEHRAMVKQNTDVNLEILDELLSTFTLTDSPQNFVQDPQQLHVIWTESATILEEVSKLLHRGE